MRCARLRRARRRPRAQPSRSPPCGPMEQSLDAIRPQFRSLPGHLRPERGPVLHLAGIRADTSRMARHRRRQRLVLLREQGRRAARPALWLRRHLVHLQGHRQRRGAVFDLAGRLGSARALGMAGHGCTGHGRGVLRLHRRRLDRLETAESAQEDGGRSGTEQSRGRGPARGRRGAAQGGGSPARGRATRARGATSTRRRDEARGGGGRAGAAAGGAGSA